MLQPNVAHSWPIMLVLGLLLPVFMQIAQEWAARTVKWIAQYPYGIYLWHSFAMKFTFRYLASYGTAVTVFWELLLTGLVSVVTYHLVEEPFIRYGSSLAERITNAQSCLLLGVSTALSRVE